MERMEQTTDQNFHFYAANIGTWATTSPERDLPALIKLMESEGLSYILAYVPLPFGASYNIRFFQPDVEDMVYMGTFKPKL